MEWFALAVLCALTVGGQPPGECLADAGTVCESVKTTPLIFLGEVKNVNWDPRDQTRPPGPQIVTFRVLEGLKGVTGAEITLSFAAAGEQPDTIPPPCSNVCGPSMRTKAGRNPARSSARSTTM